MRCVHPPGKKAIAQERLGGGQTIAGHGQLIILRASGHMQAHTVVDRHGDLGLQQVFRIIHIGRMGPKPRDDAAIGGALLLDEGSRIGQLHLPARLVAQLHDAVGHHGADTALSGCLGNLGGKKVLVAKCCRPRKQHFGTGERDC